MFQRINLQTSNNKGMALVATLIIVLVISTIAIALLSMTSSDLQLSSLQERSKETFYIADAGIDRAIAYLEKLGNPDFSDPAYPFRGIDDSWATLSEYGGEYDVEIKNSPTSSLSYIITSTGRKPRNDNDGWFKTVIESKVTMKNFAMYAYFSDIEMFPIDLDPGSGYGGKEIWFMSEDKIRGRLHSNDRINIAGTPEFFDKVTSAYINQATKDTSWRNYDGKAKPVFHDSYEGGVERIDLPSFRDITSPSDKDSLQRIAAGSEEFITDTGKSNGVYVPNSGSVGNKHVTNGIWVKGDVKELVLGTDAASGNSKIFINQTDSTNPKKETTIYTLNSPMTFAPPIVSTTTTYNSGTIVIERNVTTGKYDFNHYNEHTNGLLYVNGKINSLRATNSDGGVKGKITIASNNTITITNDIKYNTRINNPDCFEVTKEKPFPDFFDSLGIITEGNIKVATNAPNNIEINAIMMATGTSFYYEGYRSVKKDTLTVHGSFIQAQRGPVGVFSGNSRTAGYAKDYYFDARMKIENPQFGQVLPPYFPVVGRYEKQWWKQID